MKFVVVIQRVRDGNVSSPSRSKPSRQVGSKPACVIVRRGMEPGAASMQAVLLSPEICIVVVRRIISGTVERKPTHSMQRKAAVLKAIWRADRTPPGSESGACMHRDNSGTWEGRMSPCKDRKGRGRPEEQKPLVLVWSLACR
jgi:hypothetical protein